MLPSRNGRHKKKLRRCNMRSWRIYIEKGTLIYLRKEVCKCSNSWKVSITHMCESFYSYVWSWEALVICDDWIAKWALNDWDLTGWIFWCCSSYKVDSVNFFKGIPVLVQFWVLRKSCKSKRHLMVGVVT